MPQMDEKIPVPIGPAQSTSSVGGPDIESLLRLLGMQTNSAIPQGPAVVNQPHIPIQPLPQKVRPDLTFGGQNEFNTKGGRNRAALNNIFGNVTKMVQAADQNKEAKATRALAMDLERIMIAAQNPDDPHNQQVINDILSDDKRRKKISEALNIQFGPVEDKRDPQTKAALAQAMQKVQQATQAQPPSGGSPTPAPPAGGTPPAAGGMPPAQGAPPIAGAQAPPQAPAQNTYAQQLMKQMPQVAGPNASMQSLMQLMKIMSPQMVAGMNAQSRENVASTMAKARTEASQIMSEARSKDVAAQNEARLKAASVMANARIQDAKIRVKGMTDNTLWRTAGQILVQQEKSNGNSKLVSDLTKQYNSTDKKLKDLEKSLQAAEDAAPGTFNPRKFTTEGRNAVGRVLTIQKDIDTVRKEQTNILQQMKQLNTGVMNGNSAAGTSAGGNLGAGGSSQEDDDKFLNDIIYDEGGPN